MIHIVKKFAGWSLCWRREDLPFASDVIQMAFPDPDEKWDWENSLEETRDPRQSSRKGGRPRHPAFAWYEGEGFNRRGRTINELQRLMPKDGKGNPPSETTIRDWEDEFQRKLPTKTPTET